jgi:kynurenine 3-monooxygenase
MKVLQMPPGFGIPDADGSLKATENEYTYAIRSTFKGFNNCVSIGLLPVKDPSMIRPANVITRPNHELWKLTNGPAAKEWFTKAFPRFHWDDYVSDEEWDRFAKAKGTSFPFCQYSPGLQVTAPGQNSGVVLVGDSAHAFPPDIGQGTHLSFQCCFDNLRTDRTHPLALSTAHLP